MNNKLMSFNKKHIFWYSFLKNANFLKTLFFSKPLLLIVFLMANISIYANFEEANQLYLDGKYEEALKQYEELVSEGKKSENLYYNLANSYYKTGNLGKSILYYEKTLKINPENEKAKHNLRLANTKIEDALETLPELFFVKWWKKLVHFFSMNTWAWIAIAFSWFSVISFAFYLFSKKQLFKKSAFVKSFIFGFIAIVGMLIAGISSGKIFKTEEVVLVANTSYGKDAPSKNAANQELFHEGTKLVVKDKAGDFYKVETSEGNTVWVNKNDFLLID